MPIDPPRPRAATRAIEPSAAPPASPSGAARPSGSTVEVAAAAAWVALVAVAVVWGRHSLEPRPISLRAAPLAGHWAWHAGAGLLPAVVVGGAAVVAAPSRAASWPWRRVVVGSGILAVAWTVALALSDGASRIALPLTEHGGYLPFARTIGNPAQFLRSFVARLPDLPTHVKGHPPGATLAFWALRRAGIGGPGPAAVVVILAWGVAVGAVVVATRCLAGEATARRAAPFVALAPAAVWAGTTADALFAGTAAIAVAMLVIAVVQRRRGLAAVGGVVFGVALMFSYGIVVLAAVPAVVAVGRRRWQEPVVGMIGAVLVVAAPALVGFRYLDGLSATRAQYWAGLAHIRPGGYLTFVGNPAALALAVGPAAVVGLASLRRRHGGLLALVGGAALAVLVADLSQMSRGEVERIWLPFVPWLVLAAAAAPRRRWLAAQVATGLALQAALRSPW